MPALVGWGVKGEESEAAEGGGSEEAEYGSRGTGSTLLARSPGSPPVRIEDSGGCWYGDWAVEPI